MADPAGNCRDSATACAVVPDEGIHCGDGTRPQRVRGGRTGSVPITGKVAAIIFVVALAVVFGVSRPPGGTEDVGRVVLEALLIAAASAPLILLWVIRPYVAERRQVQARMAKMNEMLRREIDERLAVEEQLRTHESELELRIEEMDYVKQLVEEQAADAVGMAEDLAAQKQAVEESRRQNEYLANHDTLTGLPNRRSFEQVLKRATEAARVKGSLVTLIYVDLDNFKTVNDTLGHASGDDLLVQVADRLQAVVRDSDFVARLGGDEFAVMTVHKAGVRDGALADFAERIRAALAISVEGPDSAIPVSATLGIATFPMDAADEVSLLVCADRAMYAAKQRGRNCVAFHRELAADTTVE